MKKYKFKTVGAFAIVNKENKIFCEWGTDQLLIFSNKLAVTDFLKKNKYYKKDSDIVVVEIMDDFFVEYIKRKIKGTKIEIEQEKDKKNKDCRNFISGFEACKKYLLEELFKNN